MTSRFVDKRSIPLQSSCHYLVCFQTGSLSLASQKEGTFSLDGGPISHHEEGSNERLGRPLIPALVRHV